MRDMTRRNLPVRTNPPKTLTKDKALVGKTVKSLRRGLGDTQQAFANRLGLAISTVVRYEHTRAPTGKVLVQLADVATANGFPDCAKIFWNALIDGLGIIPKQTVRSKNH